MIGRNEDTSHWPSDTLYPQKLSQTLLTSGGHLVSKVRSQTEATEFVWTTRIASLWAKILIPKPSKYEEDNDVHCHCWVIWWHINFEIWLFSSAILVKLLTSLIISLLFSVRWNKVPSPEALGNFDLLLDEELTSQEEHSAHQSRSRSDTRTPLYRWK
jgi:hypothetical protein